MAVIHCVFKVRAFVAECPKCGDVLEGDDAHEFNECECPIEIGSVVQCECGARVLITDPDGIFQKSLRGKFPSARTQRMATAK